MARRAVINAEINPAKADVHSRAEISVIFMKVAPRITGIDNKKENFAAEFFSMPLAKAAVTVIPDLEIPGIIAKLWKIPINKASLVVILLSCFFPFGNNVDKYNMILLHIKNIPTQ